METQETSQKSCPRGTRTRQKATTWLSLTEPTQTNQARGDGGQWKKTKTKNHTQKSGWHVQKQTNLTQQKMRPNKTVVRCTGWWKGVVAQPCTACGGHDMNKQRQEEEEEQANITTTTKKRLQQMPTKLKEPFVMHAHAHTHAVQPTDTSNSNSFKRTAAPSELFLPSFYV